MKRNNSRINSQDLTSHYEGVIHDVNNMLWAICLMADLIKEEITVSHACHEKVETIAKAAQTCTVLLLKTYIPTKSHSVEKKEKFNLISLVKDVATLFACTPCQVKFKITHEKENVTIYGNKNEIRSALMNLYLNAIEAMPDGGIIYINTFLKNKIDIPYSTNKNMDKADEYITIDIKDTGVGILAENLPHIFEPHFTTKYSLKKKNRGLGLCRVQQCVSHHNGSIDVSSSPGNGTTFSMKLPVILALKKQNSRALP